VAGREVIRVDLDAEKLGKRCKFVGQKETFQRIRDIVLLGS